jgi:uncharacterized Ntn-hydrolase superfamily protein
MRSGVRRKPSAREAADMARRSQASRRAHRAFKPSLRRRCLNLANITREDFSMSCIPRRALVATLIVLAVVPRAAHATWSIVVLDRTHKWIGVAGASCTPDVYGIMSLRPGQGVLIAQAIGYDAAIERGNQLLGQNMSSDSLLRILTSATLDSGSRYRQYAVATFEGGLAQFTGDSTAPPYHGQLRDVDVLVQGNSLPNAEVLEQVMSAIRKARAARRPLFSVLMAGLAAGSKAGGDARCGAQRATSAFIVVARPGERAFLPYLTLSVFRTERGAVNAVDVLASRLRRWIASGGPQDSITSEGVQPRGGTTTTKPPTANRPT